MEIYIETQRLILREVLPTDIEGFFELDADPEVHRYLGNKPLKDKAQVVDVINFIRQQYVDNGIGRWAMIEKETNNFIGWTGLKLEKVKTNNHVNYYDLGYRLIRKYWGKGFATESAIPCLQYGFDKLDIKEVYAAADCENIGSNNILKKVGLNFVETFDHDGIKHNWYKMDTAAYENQFERLVSDGPVKKSKTKH